MRLLLPAPADLAKSKRMASNISFSGALPHGALPERGTLIISRMEAHPLRFHQLEREPRLGLERIKQSIAK